MSHVNTPNQRLELLLKDYGYRLAGDTLIERGIKGFCSDRIVGRRRGVLDAVESLIPVLRDDEFSSRYRAIVNATD